MKLTKTGGGIVFDSDPYDEWIETINKLGANIQCITSAEKLYTRQENSRKESIPDNEADREALPVQRPHRAHIDFAG